MLADLVAYNRSGEPILIVEVKKKIGVPADWAARFRRNILAHGVFPDVRYFLLAMPDRFYLWKDVGSHPEIIPPTFSVDAKPLLQAYFDEVGIEPGLVSGQGFELMVAAWLRNQLLSESYPVNNEWKWLEESGLLEAIRDGKVEHEVRL